MKEIEKSIENAYQPQSSKTYIFPGNKTFPHLSKWSSEAMGIVEKKRIYH
jgi:hypothetical protein